MKKFLSKKPVKITFIALAIAFLAFYAYMLIRPVSFGMSYKETTTQFGKEVTNTIKFKNGKKARITRESDGSKTWSDVWVYCDGYSYTVVGSTDYITEKVYEDRVKDLKAQKKENKELYEEGMIDINAFSLDEDATCTGAIVFAVVGGVVELILITFTSLTFVFAKKSKSKKKK